MDKRWAIFDMDGTLVDSMGYWRRLDRDYLTQWGFVGPETERVLEQIRPLTMLQAAQLFRQTFHLSETAQEIVDGMHAVMTEHYRRDVLLKPGVEDYLLKLKQRGCRLCVATATDERLAHVCLERLGVDGLFEFVLSCESVGVSKERPDLYLLAARRLGAEPGEIAVFEDALYAARTAKQAGFYTVAVAEPTQAENWVELTALADEVVTDWRELE
jgi:HAD superfamily hydrolase (TIGR01509 family)